MLTCVRWKNTRNKGFCKIQSLGFFGISYRFLLYFQMISLCDDHISLYQLTLERGTQLFKQVENGKLVRIDLWLYDFLQNLCLFFIAYFYSIIPPYQHFMCPISMSDPFWIVQNALKYMYFHPIVLQCQSWIIEAEWCIYTSVIYPSLVQIMACPLVGAKPSESMTEYC